MTSSKQRFLLIGAGYLGRPTARYLRDHNCEVCLWVKSAASREKFVREGFNTYAADVSDKGNWKGVSKKFDAVLYMPSTNGGDEEDYDRLYVQGMRHAVSHFGDRCAVIFISSTSVYPQQDGEWVSETSPTDHPSAKANCLLAAEELALERGGSVIRFSGIYGPGRSAMWNRLIQRRPLSVHDADRWMNHIHREDAVSALIHVLRQPTGQIINATDSLPVTRMELYRWLSARMCIAELPLTHVKEERKRGNTNKRVRNDKLLSLGWAPRYPTYKQGYEHLISTSALDTTLLA